MTRETKIGLLVGLAFVIVICILLSDHVTSTTEPVSAALPQAAENVRDSVRAPGEEEANTYGRDTVITPAPRVTPSQPVPTQNELTQPRQSEAVVKVGGPAGGQPPTVIRQSNHSPVKLAQRDAALNDSTDAPQPGDAPAQVDHAGVPEPLANAAQLRNEPLVPVGPGGDAGGSPAASRKYTAEGGDTLSHMAARFMGSNSKANRDAIIKVNPSLQQDPDKIIVGRSYLIPVVSAQAGATVAESPAAPAPVPAAPAVESAQAGTYWYTVKSNDSLWSIAADQLGNGAAWSAIKDINKDVLKGSDTVHPNMRLRLPAKPVASASAR